MNLRKKVCSVSLSLGILVVPATFCRAQAVVPTPAPATPAVGTNTETAPPATARLLRQFLLSDSIDALRIMSHKPDAGIVVLSPNLTAFNVAELAKRLAAGENQPINEKLLGAAKEVIENFLHQSEYPSATVEIPTQSIAEGVIRVLLHLGPQSKSEPVTAATAWKIRNIKMQDTRWFSESLLRGSLGIEQGRTIVFSELNQAINWTNNNPFRKVRVHLQPVPNTGEADLTIAVKEVLPLRLVASADNAGNDLIGRNRYIASVSYANMWGLDHQSSYQYITSNKPDIFKAHGFDYRVPLPWRHIVQLSASYLTAKPSLYDGILIQNGETITTDLRYSIPLRDGDNPIEIYGALNFKQSNNNLTFDTLVEQVQVFSTKPNVFQFTLGGSAVQRDSRGAWVFGASLTLSPGGINSRNTDRAFDAGRFDGGDSARVGATARYGYATVSVQRILKLSPGWDFISRGVAQVSQANLLPTEQLSIGGSSSVRGYNESIFAGDHGYVFTNELLFPSMKFNLGSLSKKRGPLEARFAVFFDAAHTGVRHRYPSDFPRASLASQGVGVRLGFAQNFSLTADYGWQLNDLPYEVEDTSRAHIKATLAF